MKKILYILSMVLLLAVACTEEVPVSRDYDIDAEVGEITTTMEMTTLYCNLSGATEETLQALGGYITEKEADVVTFVAPATIGSVEFGTWLANYAAEKDLKPLTATLTGNSLVMAALVNKALIDEAGEAEALEVALTNELKASLNPILHFEVNDVNFVVTEMKDSKNEIPANWKELVDAMTNTTIPWTYEPNHHDVRTAELASLLDLTVNNRAYMTEKNWLWGVNMNAPSKIDITKYGREFRFADCYAGVTDEFMATKTRYFSVDEFIDENDPYFNLNSEMSRRLTDCGPVYHSVYVPSSVDGSRNNYLYTSTPCLNMIEKFEVDESAADELSLSHYPIMVTLKSEE